MLSAEQSLEFILDKVEALRQGEKVHEVAAYKALMNLTQRWAEPMDSFIDDDLAMAERVGQDLAEVQRHIADLQHAYMRALFGETAASGK